MTGERHLHERFSSGASIECRDAPYNRTILGELAARNRCEELDAESPGEAVAVALIGNPEL